MTTLLTISNYVRAAMISMFHTKLQRPLEILSDDEVQQIHSATLEVLESVGVRFEDEEVLKLLDDQGAQTGPNTHLAKIPTSLVEEAIKKCPKRVTLHGRTKDHDLTLGDGSLLHRRRKRSSTT